MSGSRVSINQRTQESIPLIIHILEDLQKEDQKSPLNTGAIEIVKKIAGSPGLTRKDLIAQLKIRPGTVTKIVSILLRDAVLFEGRSENLPDRGRPEIPLFLNRNRWIAVAVTCDSKEITAMLINSADEILGTFAAPVSPFCGNREFGESLSNAISTVLRETSIPDDSHIICISISTSGIVNTIDKTLQRSARWPKVTNFSFLRLQDDFKLPVQVRRQLDVQLSYEIAIEPELKKKNVLLFHWGYGIGGAYASQGSMIASQTTSFCQIGHIPLSGDSKKRCLCGKIGCLETVAAYWALEPDIQKLFNGFKDNNEMTAAAFFKTHPLTGEPFFEKAETAIAQAVNVLQSILVPDVILLYGIFIESPVLRKSLIDRISKAAAPFNSSQAEFRYLTASHSWNARAVCFSDFKDVLYSYFRGFFLASGKEETADS